MVLRGLECRVQLLRAPLVHAVREDDDDLAADFVLERVGRGEIDGVVKMRAAHGDSREGAGERAAARPSAADGRLINGAREAHGVAREVLEKFHIGVEVHDEGDVLRPDHLANERFRFLLLDGQDALLAGAGVHQNPQGQRGVGLARKVANLLRGVVLRHLEIVFVQVRNQMPSAIFDDGKDVDDAGGDFESSGGWRRGGTLLRRERQDREKRYAEKRCDTSRGGGFESGE